MELANVSINELHVKKISLIELQRTYNEYYVKVVSKRRCRYKAKLIQILSSSENV